jgi:hypothetical protein
MFKELISLILFKNISKVFVLLREFDRFWFRLGVVVGGWVDMDGKNLKILGSPIERYCSNKEDPDRVGFLGRNLDRTRFGSGHQGALDRRQGPVVDAAFSRCTDYTRRLST